MYERQRNIFHHYDSFNSHNSPAARSLAKKMEHFLAGKETKPSQTTSVFCVYY